MSDSDMVDVVSNLKSLNLQIQETCSQLGKNPKDIKLIAVSKKKTAAQIHKAYAVGQLDFGENYANELVEKAESLKDSNITWHFIGQIQSNKTKWVAQYANWVHSISSFKIANRLNEQAFIFHKQLNVLIQVNLLQEQSKSGVSPDDLDDLVSEINEMKNLKLRGLMFIPPTELSETKLKQAFLTIGNLNEQLKIKNPNQKLDTLSFGMSADWKIALACGSNLIRIGTAIFGER